MKTKIKKLKTILIAGVCLLLGSTNSIAQTESSKQTLPEFNSIVVSSAMSISLNQSNENTISIKEGNVQDVVSASVIDNVLYIKNVKKAKSNSEKITVNFIKISKLEATSASEVKGVNQIKLDKLEVICSDASEIDLDLNVTELKTSIKNAGEVKYKGIATNHKIDMKSGSELKAYNLETMDASFDIVSASEAKLNVKQNLSGIVKEGSELTYLSEPLTKNIVSEERSFCGLKDTEVKHNDTDTTKKKDNFRIYWAGIGAGINGYLNANNQTTLPLGYEFLDLNYGRSINYSINLLSYNIPVWKEHVNVVTGVGFDMVSYSFTSKHEIIQGGQGFISAIYDSAVTFKRNNLISSYITVPLLIQFDTKAFGKKNNTLHLSAGILGGLRLSSTSNRRYEINGVKHYDQTADDFNMNPLRCDAMVRFGYGRWDVYATYALNRMFKKNQGPQLYPFSVGITLVGLPGLNM